MDNMYIFFTCIEEFAFIFLLDENTIKSHGSYGVHRHTYIYSIFLFMYIHIYKEPKWPIFWKIKPNEVEF